MHSKVPASDWLLSSALFTVTEARCELTARLIKAQPFISRSLKTNPVKRIMDNKLGRILMVEDDPRDVELSLTALEEYNLANEVVVVGDGEEALDYLNCRGAYQS